jgi:hypothetical protein
MGFGKQTNFKSNEQNKKASDERIARSLFS